MENRQGMALLSKLILIGPATVTLLVFTSGVTDPVNANKFFVLGVFSFALVGLMSFQSWRYLWQNYKIPALILAGFLLASLNSLVQSHSPVTQQLYGVYGRNNGFLLYLFLTLILTGMLAVKEVSTIKNVIFSLLISGFVNLVYCAWVLFFGDFIGWSNPYGNILGTFGNPNFIGAFLGIFSSVLMSLAILHFHKPKYLIIILLSLIITLVEIVESHAIQGRVLFVLGIAVNGFFLLRSLTKNLFPLIGFWLVTGVTGLVGLLGTLQIGPAAKYLYKESVSLRGEYWHAGLNMGWSHLFTGVGFDSYGDWYRFSRRVSALIRPGANTVSNASHNVLIDLFSFGGLPLILFYALLVSYVFFIICKISRRNKSFDFILVSLVGAWSCFQLQSLISINQVGLAIWGWLLSGALIAYDRITLAQAANNSRMGSSRIKESQKVVVMSPGLRAGIASTIGILIAVPPFAADMKLRSAQVSRSATKVEASLQPSYFNPPNSAKYLQIVGLFEDSGLTKLAHHYAKEAVKFNPRSFDSWKVLTLIHETSQDEKDLALKKMKELDPNNSSLEANPK